ncbi:methionyl-tRNA formyltransferase [Candidatus Daviesbacteria bacterium]|nr:methionyl-tRNA formyltransferase [Candidatus Daviesbacteria bacterium]
MTIVFFGNTKYSIIGAKIINKAYPISLFVTIPGSPVEHLANQLKIDVLETNRLDEKVIEEVASLKPDFLIVEDYGFILPQEILDLPKYAALNIHHSLLPKYRGPSPAPSAILAGEKISGVTIIRMTEEVDAGDILAQKEYKLTPDETSDSLLTKLNEIGGQLLVEVIKGYLEGSTKPRQQDHSKATHTKRFSKKDGYFDISNPPSFEKLDRMIRAYYPWPGVWTKWKGKIVKFLPSPRHSERSEESHYFLQMEGKRPLSLKDFLNGYPEFPKII